MIRLNSRVFRSTWALHGRNGNPIQALDHLRRADLPELGPRPGDRNALPFGAGHPPGRRQASASRPHREGGRPLAAVLFAGAKIRRGRLRRRRFVRVSRQVPRVACSPVHARGADIDAVIMSERTSSRAIATSRSRPCRLPAPREGPLRASRLRKDVLPRPRVGHDIFEMRGIDRSRAASPSCVRTSTLRMCSRSMPTTISPRSSMASWRRGIDVAQDARRL